MRTQMNNISTAAVFVGASIFLFSIFAASFLAGDSSAAVTFSNSYLDQGHGVVAALKDLLFKADEPNQPEAVNSSAASAKDTAAAAAQNYEDLKEENDHFFNLLILPLKAECHTNTNTNHSSDANYVGKGTLCTTAESLKEFFLNLKTEQVASNEREIAKYSKKIRDTINLDAEKVAFNYYQMLSKTLGIENYKAETELSFESYQKLIKSAKDISLFGNTLGNRIIKNVAKIAHEKKKLFSEYEKSYFEFMKVEKNTANKGGETNVEEHKSHQQQIVFKLLVIGQKMAEMLKTSAAETQQVWAYQQYATSVIIHSLRLGLDSAETEGKNKEGNHLKTIGENWLTKMEKIATDSDAAPLKFEDLKKENNDFITKIYKPLKNEFDANGFGDGLGETMGYLNWFVFCLERDQNASDEKGSVHFSAKIRDAINNDVKMLSFNYYLKLGNTLGKHKLYQIGNKFVNEKTLRNIYYQMLDRTLGNGGKMSDEYKSVFDHEMGNDIIKKVAKIAHGSLISEFEKSYVEFMKEEKNDVAKKDAGKGGGETNAMESKSHHGIEEMKKDAGNGKSREEIVFKLLLIGQRVAQMFKKSSAEKQQALAYQQFAINLTIHSFPIGHTKSTDEKTHDIRAIAQKWSMHLGDLAP